MIKKLLLILLLCSVCQAAVEDFTTYTVVSPLVWSTDAVTFTNYRPRKWVSYLYKDFGVDYFNGDFTHRKKFILTSSESLIWIWGVSNFINDLYLSIAAEESSVGIYCNHTGGHDWMTLSLCESGYRIRSEAAENVHIEQNIQYFVTITRDDDGGVNSAGRYSFFVCTGNYYGEVDAIDVGTTYCDSSAGQQLDFRYGYAVSSYYTDTYSLMSGVLSEQDFGGGTEDLLTFTPLWQLVVTDAQTITWTGLLCRTTGYYIYKDLGEDYFSGDFTHRFKHTETDITGSICYGFPWALTNDLNQLKLIDDAAGSFLALGLFFDSIHQTQLLVNLVINEDGATDTTTTDYFITIGTEYYYTISRDDDAGANSTGQITVYVCTDNYYGEVGANLVHTITGDCGEGQQNDFRYVHASQSWTSGSIQKFISGTVKDLDLDYTISSAGGGQLIMIQEF